MSITDELRMYVQDWRDTPSLMDDLDRGDIDGILEDFLRIADRIDAEHRAAIEKLSAMIDKSEDMYNLGFDEASDCLTGRFDGFDRRIRDLEHLTEGMLLAEREIEERVKAVERKLNHRGQA